MENKNENIKEDTTFPLGDGLTVRSISGKEFLFKVGKEQCEISRDKLYSLLFYFGDEKQQEEMIPIKETQVTTSRRLLKVKVKRDIKKGEIIKAWYDSPVSATIKDSIITGGSI